ncbi:tripartite tricarboxylate transporter TctB family protein [Aquincola sp. S2]|uniref:Tripartite tricarboxylate transporter TctB family protein n=1 Tax=Pseudaquabacterium terrae TaxID=2732868 RepID=A0ABX2EMN3_9BURK|nr:tripartite tricarboxylate transporter TctB family protein [Aquabacterium terrae]NRF69886.1 tripartite tricarboxylate transporter TctB family protein [Aquabacterium terrae]
MARVDRPWGAGWIVLGAAITAGAWRIDRLDAQGVAWFAAPGLLPGVLGVLIALCGLLLALRSEPGTSATPDPASADAAPIALPWRRVLLTLLLCLGFAVVLVGRGLPFGVAAALYLFTHIGLLQWHERGAAGQRLRGLLVAAAIAIGAGLAVPFVFEQLFLVRLP